MKHKKILLIVAVLLSIALLAGCGNKEKKAQEEAYEKAVKSFEAYLADEQSTGMVVNHNMATVVDETYMFQIKDNVVLKASCTKVTEKDGHFVPIYDPDETPAITEDMCAQIRDVDLLKYVAVNIDTAVVNPTEGEPATTGGNAIYGNLPDGSILYDGTTGELRPINAASDLDTWNPSFCLFAPREVLLTGTEGTQLFGLTLDSWDEDK